MCYNVFTIKINFFKYKRFQDGRCMYKNSGWSHLNEKIEKQNKTKQQKKNEKSKDYCKADQNDVYCFRLKDNN